MSGYQLNDRLLIDKLTETVLSNIRDENFGSVELSKAAGMNQRKIREVLKSETGKTISQFIRDVRLTKAMEMLCEGDLTAAEVAYKTGFGSPAYFNTCFHEFFGFPPGEVRKRRVHDTDNNLINRKETTATSSSYSEIKKGIARKKKSALLLSSFIIIVLIAAGSFFYNYNNSTTGKKKEIPIAVLPFKNLSFNQENQYFIDGIVDEILTNLSRISDLRVVSRTSVEQFRETITPASEIGKMLDVDYLLEGSGQKFDNKLLLRVQLIAVKNDKHIWAETYEREIRGIEDIITIQSEVARKIAAALKVSMSPQAIQAMDKIPTSSLTAYDYYLKGFNECYYNKRFDRGEVLFKKALALDSTFSYAYSGLFIVYKARHYYSSYYSADYMDSLLILSDKSLKFDRNYWPGYLGRGEYYSLTGKHDKAVEECNKSLEINPGYWVTYNVLASIYHWNNYYADYAMALNLYEKAAEVERGEQLPTTLYWLGVVYGNFAGFPQMAKKYFNEAFDLKNDSIEFLNHLAYFEMVNGHFDRAVELAMNSYSIDTNNREALRVLGLSYLFKRQYRESLICFRKFTEILNAQGEFQTSSMVPVGYAYKMNGFNEEAERWYNEQKRLSEVSLKYGRWYSAWGFADLDLGIMYSLKGDREKAYKYLRKFSKIKVCPLFLITDMKYSPIYDNLRNDMEFKILFRDMELKYLAEHERLRGLMQSEQ